MLAAAVLNLTALTSPQLRRFGLVGDAVAIWSRATRQRRAWRPHEARCHHVVRRSVSGLQFRRTVLVLGSGLIRDVPLAFLTAQFERVVLLDAVHLLPARLKAGRAGAEPVVADLTGAAGWLAGEADGRSDPLSSWRKDPSLDLVISANVLSQLPIAIERWLERRPHRAAHLPADLPRLVSSWHLADLARLHCRVCLLTDVAYRVLGRAGSILEQETLIGDERLPPPEDSWDWQLAPFGEIGRGEAHIHREHGYSEFRPS